MQIYNMYIYFKIDCFQLHLEIYNQYDNNNSGKELCNMHHAIYIIRKIMHKLCNHDDQLLLIIGICGSV